MKNLSVALLLAATATAPAWAATDPATDKILGCMRANIPKTLQIKEIELVATDRAGGERMLRGRLYGTNENDKLRAMMKVSAPADLAGAAYLLREGQSLDEMYVYVPALNKVRRISGASVDGSLWGTDLSYADVKQVQNAFSGATTKLEGSAEIDKLPMHVLSFSPAAGEATRYNKIRAWVDKKTCVTVKVEFYEANAVRKILSGSAKDQKQGEGGHWYVSDALMTDVKEGTKTRVKVVGLSTDKHLADRYFNPSTFYVGN
ncbi:MAG TPA: outer membrane lipoprotein-sorting protein [Solimonas sp.]|nr:outer membrane lipoprotein-sorting protein [Solimonas sp.]